MDLFIHLFIHVKQQQQQQKKQKQTKKNNGKMVQPFQKYNVKTKIQNLKHNFFKNSYISLC